MQIGTNYNVQSAQTKVTPKAKETASSDQVVLGGNTTDNTLSMGDQLKNMKSFGFDLFDITASPLSVIGGGAGAVGAGYLTLQACSAGGIQAKVAAGIAGAFMGASAGSLHSGYNGLDTPTLREGITIAVSGLAGAAAGVGLACICPVVGGLGSLVLDTFAGGVVGARIGTGVMDIIDCA